jgi:hypothetical protein
MKWMKVFSSEGSTVLDTGYQYTDSLFSSSLIFYRYCASCNPLFRHIYYKRISAVPPTFSAYRQMLLIWQSDDNYINTDFHMYGSYADLRNDTNRWQFCNYDDIPNNVAFPRDCAPSSGETVSYNWNSKYGYSCCPFIANKIDKYSFYVAYFGEFEFGGI